MKNKTKLLLGILIPVLLVCAFPLPAAAATYAPEDGDTLDISTCVSGDVITVSAGKSVTLTGNSVTLTNVRIICEAGVNLTLQNVIINNSSISGACPLSFMGGDNNLMLESGTASTLAGGSLTPGISVAASAELTLENNGTLTTTGGSRCAGLQCPEGATLTVSGEGTLNSEGGRGGGAGIGGGHTQKSGTMTFLSGTIEATVSPYSIKGTIYSGAGIGGGDTAACGSITISGGNITATGGGNIVAYGFSGIGGADITITGGTVEAKGANSGAGIGGKSYSGSTIMITGGTVNATGRAYSMGIGSGGGDGTASTAPKVTIEGGTVYATGGIWGGAGIGGRHYSSGGEVKISGGTVYAGGGDIFNDSFPNDIGPGADGADGSLTISGAAEVFLKNSICTSPTTTTHNYSTYPTGTTAVYGTAISIPNTWTADFGAYLRPCTLTYDINSGSGTAPVSVTQLYDTTVTLSDGSGLSCANYHFDGWNSASDGSGNSYAAGEIYTIAADTTLYAKWTADALMGTVTIDDTTPEFGQTLTASLTGGNNTGTLSYQWKRGAANIGTNSATYTLVADDVGQTITVTISSSIQTGTLTSDPTSSVDKADCAAVTGVTPVLEGKTHNSITLAGVTAYEYLLVADGAAVAGTWQDSNVFTSLSASTAYDIYQRVKETATHKASGTSAKLDITTNAAPTYSASVSPMSKTFAAAGIGYGAVEAQDFTITNDGSGTITNLSAALEGSDFEISAEPASSISPADMATVSVRPVTGLSPGDYTDTLTISADNGISLTVTLSFPVLAPAIDPALRNYDLNAPADITTAITWNGATSVTGAVYSINSDVTIYTLDTGDYTAVGNDLTIESSFFEGLSLTTGAAFNFVFTFDTGDEAALTVNAVDGFVPVTTYNVTFSSNGSAYATKTVNAGESIGSGNFPSEPTRSSYSFGGWFTGENGAGTEFTSTTSVNATIAVYAKWTYSGGSSRGSSETTPAPTKKTITVTETSCEVLKDAAGTITAEANMDNAFSNSVEVKVTDTPEDAANFGLGAADDVYPFDISLYIKGTNEKTQPAPGYAVTISLPIPENLLDKRELLSVVHKSDSGVVTELTSRLVQKVGTWYLIFEATEFSPYALAVRNAESYDESAGMPYYLDANGSKVFIGFAANGRYIAPEGVTVSVMQNDKGFTDITGHWAEEYIGFVTERKIFVGTGGNTISPGTGMTRAMFATVIGRLYERSYGEIEASDTNDFTDCDYSTYYGKYIAWASENSIIGGVGDGKFAPDTLITREQMAAILYRFAEFLGVLPGAMDTVLSYPDADSIPGYAKPAALYCQTTGVIDGRTGGVFDPQETATRAEVATIIQRFVEAVMK